MTNPDTHNQQFVGSNPTPAIKRPTGHGFEAVPLFLPAPKLRQTTYAYMNLLQRMESDIGLIWKISSINP